MREIKLGSLFDGSGGFPLAGCLNGVTPVWASEVEPYAIRVTQTRFPHMKHLGSVTEVHGDQVEPVDIITFGSPCQDLSVAGKQLGIHEGQRSNLFFEAIRIIKEMRNATANQFPRFAIWENVPGAFSSNKGQDFQAVLQAFCTIRGGHDHIIPMPPGDKWLPFGTVVGDGWSLAWRVYDAQYRGVPQRRKRIYLIADFGSERAGEILSEPESVRRDYPACGTAREGTAEDAERSPGGSDCAVGADLYNGCLTGDKAATLSANTGNSANHAGPSVLCEADRVHCLNPWDCQSKRQYGVDGAYRTLDAGNGAGGQHHGVCYPAAFMGGQGAKARTIAYCDDGSTPTLKSVPSGGNTVPDVVYPINTMVALRGGKDDMRTCFGVGEPGEPQFTLSAAHEHAVCYGIDCRNAALDEEKTHTIQAKANGGQSLNCTPSVCYRKSAKPTSQDDAETWVEDEKANTINTFENSDVRTAEAIVYRQGSYGAYTDGIGTLKASGGDAGGVRKALSLSVYDARGNGDGETVPTLTGDHQNRVSDYSCICVERKRDE